MALLMSTNYFWKEIPKSLQKFHVTDPDMLTHIGHTAAAGPYCKKCGITFCSEGTWKVHDGDKSIKWYDECPVCGTPATSFAYSFSWTMMRHKKILERLVKQNVSEKLIIDECDREYTPKQFLKVVNNASITAQLAGTWR